MATPPAAALLRMEGIAEAIAALVMYHWLDASWWLFAALVLVPDVSFLGYLAGSRIGAITYNVWHMMIGPALLACLGLVMSAPLILAIAIIWYFHIGWDRALGYGLKTFEGFEYTHLGPIGRLAATGRDNRREG
jgi:hypothetical protein